MCMPRIGSKKVALSFSAGRLTHFGGVYLLHRFLQQLQLRTFLSRQLRTAEWNNYFTLTERFLALMYPMILGLNSIELSALLGTNGVFQSLTGLPRFPHPNTLRYFLSQKAPVLLPSLCTAHNKLRRHFLVLPQPHTSYWLDFDSTVKTLYGQQEGVVKGYNPAHRGKRSYHPLLCTEAHFQDCLGGALRFGNAYTSEGVLQMLDTTLSILPASARTIRVRADSGFYDGDFIGKLRRLGIQFAIVAKMSRPLQSRVKGLRYTRVKEQFATAHFRYQPHGWSQSYDFVVLREELTEERKAQLKLFTFANYAYHAIVTDLRLTPWGVFSFYKERTAMERIIRSLKEDYPFATAPNRAFTANSLYAELSMLSYNLIVWFKRLCLPQDWQSYTVGTLRHRLLLVPGVFTRTGNRPVLKLPKNCPHQDVFQDALRRIDQLDSLLD